MLSVACQPRRLATLVAFVHCLEATAQDAVPEVLEMLLHDLSGKAITTDQKARLRGEIASLTSRGLGVDTTMDTFGLQCIWPDVFCYRKDQAVDQVRR